MHSDKINNRGKTRAAGVCQQKEFRLQETKGCSWKNRLERRTKRGRAL